MFSDETRCAPILVIGVGNILLKDDGVGIELVTRLASQAAQWGEAVEFMDGGTQGMALLGHLAGRRAIVFLDAVELGAEAGSLHVLESRDTLALGSRSTNAHEGNVGELLRAARLLGDLPESLRLIGIEPKTVGTGIGLSEPVQAAIPAALQAANSQIDNALSALQGYPAEKSDCLRT